MRLVFVASGWLSDVYSEGMDSTELTYFHIVTRLRAGRLTVLISAGVIYLLQNIEASSGAQPESYPMGNGAPSRGGKVTEAWSWPSLPPCVKVRNKTNYTSDPPICLHNVSTANFTFTSTAHLPSLLVICWCDSCTELRMARTASGTRLTLYYACDRSWNKCKHISRSQCSRCGRPTAWVCGPSPAGTAGSNPARGIDVCLLWVLCIDRYRSLGRADPSSREAYLVCVCVCHWVLSGATITSIPTMSRQRSRQRKKERKQRKERNI
jgi:hypothetical protein